MRFRVRVLGTMAAALALCAPAVAGEKVHTVDSGDSASSIADKYYGDVKLGDFLLRYNGKIGTVIHAGEKMKVPFCEVHKVGKGDTWGTLATKYLGRTSAHAAIASLNGFAAGEVLPAGASIVIPVVLTWRLERGESLASLADSYYGDPNRADLLQLFNEVEDPRRLSVGETVRIPLTTIRLHKSKAAELPPLQPVPVRLAKAAPKDPPIPPNIAAKAPLQSPPADAKKPAENLVKTPQPKPAVGNKEPAATTGKAQQMPAAPKPEAGASPTTGDDNAGEKAAADPPKDHLPEPGADKSKSQPKDPAPEPVAGKTGQPATDAVEVPQAAPSVKASPRFEKYIREAARAFADGEYARARLLLESLREKSRSDGNDEERAEILRLLAFVYIAFDMRSEACSAFQSLPRQQTPTTLDPDLVSPRIRDALSRCAARRS